MQLLVSTHYYRMQFSYMCTKLMPVVVPPVPANGAPAYDALMA